MTLFQPVVNHPKPYRATEGFEKGKNILSWQVIENDYSGYFFFQNTKSLRNDS